MEIDSSGLNIGEVASVWTPSITITIFGIDISVGAEIGAVGGSLNVGNGSLSVQGTLGIGASIEIERESQVKSMAMMERLSENDITLIMEILQNILFHMIMILNGKMVIRILVLLLIIRMVLQLLNKGIDYFMEESFANFDELEKNVKRGGEIEFIYNNKSFSITHFCENGRHKVSVMQAYNYDSEKIFDIEEISNIGNYTIDGEKLKNIISHCQIVFRCF